MIEKRGLLIVLEIFVMILFLIVLNMSFVSASLGIRPGLIETDFKSGMEFFINFNAIGVDPEQSLTVYATGDFAEYVSFDKTKLKGSEGFTAYVSLPEEAVKPGKNRLYITLQEDVEEGEGFSARLQVGALILIKVPYPGKYAEIKSFDVTSVNEGDPVNFKLVVDSVGKEEVSVTGNVVVYSDKGKIGEVDLGTEKIKSGTSKIFQKNVEGYNPGVYNSTAFINFGIIQNETKEFRVGTLFINITNWTSQVNKGKISKFEIEVESRWNNDLSNVYAEVNVSKNGEKIDSFMTPSIELVAWQKEILTGFFDSENLDTGKYDADIALHYGSNMTNKKVKIEVVSGGIDIKLILIIGSIILVFLLLLGTIVYLFLKLKKKDKNVKKNKK